MRRLLQLALISFCFGCPTEDQDVCFVGDPNLPPEIEPIFRNLDNEVEPIVAGGDVPLILPPQGGKVLVVGVRAKNMNGCPINLSVSLRDVCSDVLLGVEQRPVTLEPNPNGWLEPLLPAALENYSNFAACPNENLDRAVDGEPYLLTLRATDKDGRMAEKMVEIVPACSEAVFMEQCICECSTEYPDCKGDRPDAGPSECVR